MHEMRKTLGVYTLSVLAVIMSAGAAAEDTASAARALIARVIPEAAAHFAVEVIPAENGNDVFEIQQQAGKIILRGSTGVAVASALNHYLEKYCNASVSLRGSQLELPEPLPGVPEKIRITTPFRYRYCLNYCCFSYSLAWYDWPQWERLIDWMALHGVNMPLAITGQEAVWLAVARRFGLDCADLKDFLPGPAWLPFGWMGCLDGWGGPLPESWIESHRQLQTRILERERALGMTPVLQGFTGHVPSAIRETFPDTAFLQLPGWSGFEGTWIIDPAEPLFTQFGKAFLEEQTRLFGTDHLYAADTFIEVSPPARDPAFLDAMGKAVYNSMNKADSDARWVMQGWIFVHNRDYWKPPQIEAYLKSVPRGRLLCLDLYCETQPAWILTEAFQGNPWLWCIIQDFGDVVSLHGGLPQIAHGLRMATGSPSLAGAGFMMEGLGYNPVVQSLMSSLFWNPDEQDLEAWITDYAASRYGRRLPGAESAWRRLLDTVYSEAGRTHALICWRPSAGIDTARMTGNPGGLLQALPRLLQCAEEQGHKETYQYDVVNITRELLSNLAAARYTDIMTAYRAGAYPAFTAARAEFLQLLADMDELLAAQEGFLLGRWIEDAKRWGANEEERRLLEWNARTLITLWGPPDGLPHDYANKQWAGLIKDFYLPRWKLFFAHLERALKDEKPYREKLFQDEVRLFEDAWTRKTNTFATVAKGGPVTTAKRLFEKYLPRREGSRTKRNPERKKCVPVR
jgi:alpha-N-acetylglucosaminidase